MTSQQRTYTCPMHPEVRQPTPGVCPKCGMALEPVGAEAPMTRTEYVCPMHPQIVRDAPGSCPICGMALEPRTVTGDEENAELKDMTRRFWVSVALSVPLLAFVMGDMLPGQPLRHALSGRLMAWLQLVLATPVVLWGGWPFFARGWASIVNRSLNMFTLIALGTGTAYVYSVIAALAPGMFPESFRTHGGEVELYFEAAALITTLVLLGQVIELRARSQTSSAIKALLGLTPKTARRLRDDGGEADASLDEVRPGARRGRRDLGRRLGPARAGAADGLRPRECGGGAHHCLSVRPRAGHADVDHGRHGARRHGGCPHQERRGARDPGKDRHARRGQDGNAHQRQAPEGLARDAPGPLGG